MESVFDIRSFDPRFKTGLIFSVFEGLLQGQGFRLICDQDPTLLLEQFEQAKIKNIQWQIQKLDGSTWQVKIAKASSPEGKGCCGCCGNEKE